MNAAGGRGKMSQWGDSYKLQTHRQHAAKPNRGDSMAGRTVGGGGVPHEVELGARVLVLGAGRAADGLN